MVLETGKGRLETGAGKWVGRSGVFDKHSRPIFRLEKRRNKVQELVGRLREWNR